MVLLSVLGYGSSGQRRGAGLVVLALLMAGALFVESGLLQSVWPRLLR